MGQRREGTKVNFRVEEAKHVIQLGFLLGRHATVLSFSNRGPVQKWALQKAGIQGTNPVRHLITPRACRPTSDYEH